MAKRIIIKKGDIFCVEIDGKYKCYFQYICDDTSMLDSCVIKVFKTRYSIESKPIIEDIIKDKVLFYAHTIVSVGIHYNAWYKIGMTHSLNIKEFKNIIWGIVRESLTINPWTSVSVKPLENWNIWLTNEPVYNIGSLHIDLWDSIEYGPVLPYIEIVNRIKYGYYKYTSPVFDIIKRIPHLDVHSYIRRESEHTIIYQHFLGEDVIQEIIVSKDGGVELSEGNPLDRPKFWETNWRHKEFITETEFNEAWNKYK